MVGGSFDVSKFRPPVLRPGFVVVVCVCIVHYVIRYCFVTYSVTMAYSTTFAVRKVRLRVAIHMGILNTVLSQRLVD